MKKTLLTSIILLTGFSNSALAQNAVTQKSPKKLTRSDGKTQGSYLQLDVIGNKLTFHEEYSKYVSGKQTAFVVKPSSHNFGGGVGLNYKYAFNFNGIFVAPGVFVEKLGTRVKGTNKVEAAYPEYVQLDVSNRFGAFLNVGYDINSYLSPYLMGGYSRVGYRSKNAVRRALVIESAIEESTTGSNIWGAGLKVNYNKNIAFNIEFNTQKFKAKTNTDVSTNVKDLVSVYQARLNSLKLGISYNF